jgi:hypothetical protein
MAVSTVNISFQEDLLKQKWESIFAYGESISSKYKFTERDINNEIEKYNNIKIVTAKEYLDHTHDPA